MNPPVAFTTLTNQRSQAVMQRIGMRYAEGEDFMHPALPSDHPLRHHVLYRFAYEDWLKTQYLVRDCVSIAIVYRSRLRFRLVL